MSIRLISEFASRTTACPRSEFIIGRAGDLLLIDGVEGLGVSRQLLGPSGETIVASGLLLSDPEPLVLAATGQDRLLIAGHAGNSSTAQYNLATTKQTESKF